MRMCKLRFLDIRHAHLPLDLEYHLITGGLLLGQQSLQVGIFFLEKLTAGAGRVEVSVALCQASLVHVVTDLFPVTCNPTPSEILAIFIDKIQFLYS